MGSNEDKNEEMVLSILADICVNEMGDSLKVEEVIYRPDYQDYQIVIEGGRYHCEIREKLFIDYAQHQHPDLKKEIIFRLDNLMEFEDWEDGPDSGKGGGGGDGMIIEDDPN